VSQAQGMGTQLRVVGEETSCAHGAAGPAVHALPAWRPVNAAVLTTTAHCAPALMLRLPSGQRPPASLSESRPTRPCTCAPQCRLYHLWVICTLPCSAFPFLPACHASLPALLSFPACPALLPCLPLHTCACVVALDMPRHACTAI